MEYDVTPEALDALIGRHDYFYQRVPLPHGREIKGKDREPLMKKVFPADFKGKSVMDVGCSLGYYLFVAEQRGAGRCIGLERSASAFEHVTDIRDTLGSKVEFHKRELGDWDEPVDYLIGFNVLHHVTDPLRMLHRMVELTKHTLLLEYVTPLNGKYKRLFNVTDAMMNQPLIAVGGLHKPDGILTFAFTPAAMMKILRQHIGVEGDIQQGVSPELDRRWLVWHRP